jgi:hypothetical protein
MLCGDDWGRRLEVFGCPHLLCNPIDRLVHRAQCDEVRARVARLRALACVLTKLACKGVGPCLPSPFSRATADAGFRRR